VYVYVAIPIHIFILSSCFSHSQSYMKHLEVKRQSHEIDEGLAFRFK